MCWRTSSFYKALEMCTPHLGKISFSSFSSFISICSSAICAAGHSGLDSMCCQEAVCRNLGLITFSILYPLASEKCCIILARLHVEHEPTHRLRRRPKEMVWGTIPLYLVVKRETSMSDELPWTNTVSNKFINARRTEHKLSTWRAGSFLESVTMWRAINKEIQWCGSTQDLIWSGSCF